MLLNCFFDNYTTQVQLYAESEWILSDIMSS